MRTVFLLCGGKGTRLSTITQGLPKPLVPFPDISKSSSILEQIIHRFRLAGIKHFCLVVSNSNYQFFNDKLLSFESQFDCSFSLLIDLPGTSGTASWLSQLRGQYDEIIISNGDTYLSGNLFGFIESRTDATIGVTTYSGTDSGLVRHTRGLNSKVLEFSEKASICPVDDETIASTYSGIIKLKGSALQLAESFVSSFNGSCSIEFDLLPFLLRNTLVSVSDYRLRAFDIGTISRYYKYAKSFPNGFVNPVVFWDRDNTLNYDSGYSHRPDCLKIIEDRIPLMQHFSSIGYSHIVVTNQSGIGRGIFTEKEMHLFNEELRSQFLSFGIYISSFLWCPHLPSDSLNDPCNCRKPKPGLLEAASKSFNIDLCSSFLIGDKLSDIEAASSLSIPALLIQPDSNLLSTVSALSNFFASQT